VPAGLKAGTTPSSQSARVTATCTSTPTITITATPTATTTVDSSRLLQAVVAAPNVSRNGNPIHLSFTLGRSAQVHMMVYSLNGKMVYQAQTNGQVGVNELLWQAETQAHQKVAGGLYLYVLTVDGDGEQVRRSGKMLVYH